ncbi:hypothetical protein SAMN02745823_02529 [Sporobacter termitidis DSM 10068]|uniref:Uncharacterized protein n=1 Tax=Sporobacter termitidis DSM 10068 TaxID=1123282 RepID=A0A1M5YH49_9FIRM|nr:hypothetical protein [Sporobacter termitidis]SHI11335.1 hypothetical protein SAMN02745823_02529 [Sporobacter termitidis DSM 10068]
MAEREKKKRSNFFTYNNNNGIPSMNKQNHFNVEENSDWESRKDRYRGKLY